MRIPIFARLLAVVVGVALWGGGLAAPACALGQIMIFRDVVLTKKFQAYEGKMTLLQIQAALDAQTRRMAGRKIAVRGNILEVYPPEDGKPDSQACKVVVAITAVTGFSAPELPVVTYFVPRSRALALKLNGKMTIMGRLYALDRFGAVAVELDAPPGWKDPEEGPAAAKTESDEH